MGTEEARGGRTLGDIHSFIEERYDGDLHAKRVVPLAGEHSTTDGIGSGSSGRDMSTRGIPNLARM